MKYISITLILTSLIAVGSLQIAEAHTAGGSSVAGEQSQVTEQEFEEIQGTMIKMMNGEELSEAEVEEMNEFMADHHGGYAPAGIMPMYSGSFGDRGYMMNGWGLGNAGYMPWLGTSIAVVWLLAGLLLVVYLAQKLMGNKRQ